MLKNMNSGQRQPRVSRYTTASVDMQKRLEKAIKEAFPDEVALIFARTGTAEVATDPMGPNVSDTYLMLHPRAQWTKASTQEELAEEIEKVVETQIGQNYEFSQPIELRFAELVDRLHADGVRTCVEVGPGAVLTGLASK